MDIWVWAVFGAMAILIAVLILNIHLLRKSAGEISRAFEDRLSQNTTTPLITHRFPLSRIEEAYRIFENKEDNVIKIAIYND